MQPRFKEEDKVFVVVNTLILDDYNDLYGITENSWRKYLSGTFTIRENGKIQDMLNYSKLKRQYTYRFEEKFSGCCQRWFWPEECLRLKHVNMNVIYANGF